MMEKQNERFKASTISEPRSDSFLQGDKLEISLTLFCSCLRRAGDRPRFGRRRRHHFQLERLGVCDATGRKVSLIGWSLGGLYAREMAKEFPQATKMFEQPIMDRDYFMRLADTFRSPHLWKREGGEWKLRSTVWQQS